MQRSGNAVLVALLLVITASSYMMNCRADKQNSWINKERILFDKLMKNYNPHVLPTATENDTLQVQFQMSLIHIIGLDETKQALHTNAWLRYKWKDAQLTWNPQNYSNINTINIPSELIWKPDIVLYNNYKASYDLTFHPMAIISNDGTVIWIPEIHISSHCSVDLQKFPFDTQVCSLRFGSWTYHGNKLNLTWFYKQDILDTNDLNEHTEFKVTGSKGKRTLKYYSCCTEPYIDLTYNITLERKANYATHMFIVPSVLLCFILPAIFILPPESKEKVFFGVGLMLGNAMVLSVINDMVPAAHPTMSNIGLFHMVNMILTAIALFISIVVMNIWAKGDRGKKLPGFVQSFILGVFGRVLCVPREDFMQVSGTDRPPVTMRSLEVLSDSQQQLDDDKEDVLRKFAQTSQRAEWRQLAIIIDRLCFLLYSFIVVVTTMALANN